MSSQLSIFNQIYQPYKISKDKKLRLIELFGGIGCQARALERMGVDFEHYKLVEFDKYAIMSYNAIHGTNFETKDICQTHASDLEIKETDKYEYLMTYSFPCTDLSLAGCGGGMKKGSGTRSGLLWEVERILNECDELPQLLLMENVPQVLSEKFLPDFQDWMQFLESKGYSNYYQILNAKDYGIPQNRARCFMVSLLGEYTYEFPQPIPLKLRLKDLLEDNVDDKYYLSERMVKYITSEDDKYKVNVGGLQVNREIACAKTTREGNTRADASDYIVDGLPDNYNLVDGGGKKPTFKQALEKIQSKSYVSARNKIQEKDWCDTLCARDYKEPKCVIVKDTRK